MTVSGQRNAFVNCDFEGMGDTTASVSSTSRNLKITAGENYFRHCNIGLDTVARTNANASVEVASNAARTLFESCTFPIYSSDGLQYALLVAAASGFDRWILFRNCTFIATGTATAQLFHLATSAGSGGGFLALDYQCAAFNVTAVGDTGTKAQVYLSGIASTNGGNIAHIAT